MSNQPTITRRSVLLGAAAVAPAIPYLPAGMVTTAVAQDAFAQTAGASLPSPTLDLNFALMATQGEVLDSRLTLTRATPAWRFNSSGLLASVGNGISRLDYGLGSTTLKGLLIEGARTNVVLHNRDLTNAAWTKSSTTAAKTTGIDGVSNSASTLTTTNANGTCLQAITLASSARYQTCYIKRITGSGTVNMTMDNGSTWTAVTVTGSWTRVTIPTQTLANPIVGFRIVTSGDAVAIDCVQNENGTFPSSPILTTTASVTRDTEVVTILTSSFTYNQSAGTFVIEGCDPPAGMTGDHCVLQAKDTDLGPLDGHIISRNNTAGGVGQWGGETYVNDVNHLGVFPQDAWTAGEAFKIAYCYAANDGHVAFNGRLAGSPDTSGSLPAGTVDQLRLGTSVHGKNPHYGHFRRLRYFDRRVANATLQSLTTL